MNLKLALSLVSLTGMAAAVSAAPIVHNYDLKNVLWKLSFSMDRGMIAGDVTNTLTLTEGSSNVQLHCADLNVSKVLVDGIKATFTIADDKLTIKLPKPAASGQTLKVRTIYTGSPVNGFYFVPDSRSFPSKTGMVYTQGEGEDNHYWLPTYDSPDDKATTECYVTVPKTWTAISNGKLLGVTPAGAMRTFHWKMDQPYSTYLISLVAGEYVKGSDQWHGIPVDFYVPSGLLAQGKASFGETSKMIDLYSKLTGVNYPYPKFAQEVVADFMFGGMENVTCVTQTIRTLHAAGTEPVNDSTYLVAHELAHQWFGDLITCKTWEHLWLNEGFATTLPIYLARANHGVDAYDIARYRNFEGAIDTFGARGRKDVPGLAGSTPTVMMGSVYDGGCSRIMMLARMLGESTFWAGIHTFLEKYKFQPATTQEFFDVMSKVSHQDLNPFMRQWFYTSTTPSLTATVSDGNLVINQLQPYYTLDLPVWSLDGDNWVKNFIHVEGAQSKLKLGDLAAKPLLIDPEVWTPMELHYAIPMTEHDVYEMYRRAPNVAQKARIISGMFDSISVSQRIAIGHGEKYYDLLSMIAGKVGQEGISFLLELTRNADARVVNAAVTNLGNLTLDEAATSRLKEIVKSSSNETIREHATQALLNNTNEGTLAESTWSKKAFDDGYRVMALDWWGKHSPDAARARSMEILRHPDSEPVRITAIRVLGRVKDKPDEDFVMRALVKVAQETSYNARNAAIQSLGQLGNKAAIPYLKPIATHAPNGIKGTASTVIDQLSKIP